MYLHACWFAWLGKRSAKFHFLCMREKLVPLSVLDPAVLVTLGEQLGQQKCRTTGLPGWPSSTVPAAGTGGDWAQSNAKVGGAQRYVPALSLPEGTGAVSTRWHGRLAGPRGHS